MATYAAVMNPAEEVRTSHTPAIVMACVMIATISSSQGATLIFSDTYNYTTGSPANQTNLATDAAARQAAGSVTSSYTEQLAGAGTRDAMLVNANGQSQLRFQTTNHASSSSQTAVDLSTNFASNLIGKHYKISFTDLAFVRGNTDATDTWFSVAVGDSTTSISGPNDATADVASIIRTNGTLNRWEDNVNLGTDSSGLSVNYDFASRYALIELHVDETTNTAWMYAEDMSGGTFTSTTWSIDFENNTNRYIELRAHQGATGTDGSDMSVYLNSLSVTIVPEPSTVLLAGCWSLLLLRRRRN